MPPQSPIMTLILRHREHMTASQGRLADHVLAHPLLSATMGIEELAAASGVSIATVNRFVKALGLGSFAEFRARSLEAFRRTIAPVEKLRDQTGAPLDTAAIIGGGLDAAEVNIATCREFAQAEAYHQVAEIVAGARTLAILGLGISAALAQFAAEQLAPFSPSQVLLTGWGGQARMVPRAMRLDERDAVLVLTLPRYSSATVGLTRTLSQRSVRVIGVTDAPTSPIVPFCEVALFGGVEHPVLHASSVGMVATIEGLTAILTRRRQTAADAANLADQIYPYLFDDGDPAAAPPEDEW